MTSCGGNWRWMAPGIQFSNEGAPCFALFAKRGCLAFSATPKYRPGTAADQQRGCPTLSDPRRVGLHFVALASCRRIAFLPRLVTPRACDLLVMAVTLHGLHFSSATSLTHPSQSSRRCVRCECSAGLQPGSFCCLVLPLSCAVILSERISRSVQDRAASRRLSLFGI